MITTFLESKYFSRRQVLVVRCTTRSSSRAAWVRFQFDIVAEKPLHMLFGGEADSAGNFVKWKHGKGFFQLHAEFFNTK